MSAESSHLIKTLATLPHPKLLSQLRKDVSSLTAVADDMFMTRDALVSMLSDDSRLEQKGALFFAVRGHSSDGHDFIREAVKNGAVAAVVEKLVDVDIPQLVVKSVRGQMGVFASVFYDRPSEQMDIVGITGTNGKTTTCHLVYSCFLATDDVAGEIGTIENRVGNRSFPSALTTPEAIELQSLLYIMRKNNVRRAAMEVSSHALDLSRTAAINFRIGIFLNLTPEHLEYHKTMEAYFLAKAKLFNKNSCKQAVICIDDEWGKRLADMVEIPVFTFGYDKNADFRIETVSHGLDGIELTIFSRNGTATIKSKLIGTVNANNLTAAYISATLLGIDKNTVIKTLESSVAPPGRFEIVSDSEPYLVSVDYAHTPEALGSLIETTRAISPNGGKITVVLGARGNRFRAKRPLMGEAAETADRVIYTTDSPADEDPLSIIKDMLGDRHLHTANIKNGTTCCHIVVELNRSEAIKLAVANALAGDVVLITGRGHENSQKISDSRVFLDDRDAAREAIRLKKSTGTGKRVKD